MKLELGHSFVVLGSLDLNPYLITVRSAFAGIGSNIVFATGWPVEREVNEVLSAYAYCGEMEDKLRDWVEYLREK